MAKKKFNYKKAEAVIWKKRFGPLRTVCRYFAAQLFLKRTFPFISVTKTGKHVVSKNRKNEVSEFMKIRLVEKRKQKNRGR